MKKVDDMAPNLEFFVTVLMLSTLGILLQLGLSWIAMPLVGILGSFFTRRHRESFLAGFIGVSIAWGVLFGYMQFTAHALVIADFFIGILGLTGMGWLVLLISVLLGGLLGGFGGLLGRSLIEFTTFTA